MQFECLMSGGRVKTADYKAACHLDLDLDKEET